MSFNKHIFKQFDKGFKHEVDKYEASQEKKKIKFKKCKHTNAKYLDGELRCTCGAAWRGPRLADLQDFLKRRKHGRTNPKSKRQA